MAEETVERLGCGVAGQQVAAQHLPGGKGEVGDLQEHKAPQVVPGEGLETDDDPTTHGDRRRHQRPRVEATRQGIVDHGDVDGREHREQQHLGHGQHLETAVQAQVGDAKLQGTCQPEPAQQRTGQTTPEREGGKDQGGDADANEHGKVAVDLAGQVLPDQAEREGPQGGDDEKLLHGAPTISPRVERSLTVTKMTGRRCELAYTVICSTSP